MAGRGLLYFQASIMVEVQNIEIVNHCFGRLRSIMSYNKKIRDMNNLHLD